MTDFDTDVIIIGAGLGGLTSAIFIGQLGLKVTVVERRSVPGGLLRSYTRQGVECPVGLHYFGPADEGELLRQIFDILGVTDQLKLRRFGSGGVLERYVFDNFIFDLPATLPAFEESLHRCCPNDTKAVKAIVAALVPLAQALRLDTTGRVQSNFFSPAAFDQSMDDFLAGIGCSKKLYAILTAHGFWSGLPMDKCPAFLLLNSLGALLVSAWELGCSGTQMVDAYVERANATGTDLLLGDPVEHVLVRDGHACGVRLKSGRSITCRKMIAAIHPKLVLDMLPRDAVSPEYRRGLEKLEETPGAVCVRLLVDAQQQKSIGYNVYRIHASDRTDYNGIFMSLRESGLEGYTTLTIVRGSAYSDWMKWQGTQTGCRGIEYEQAKADIARSMIATARSTLGDLGKYRVLDVSTPLTLRDWAASPQGSVYGLLRSVKNPLQYSMLTRMPVRSLYLAGQNAIAPGLLGVMLSVLRGVGEVVGRSNLRDFLARRLAA